MNAQQEKPMKQFIDYCRHYGTVLTLAMFVARWTCGQQIIIIDDEGDNRISSPDYKVKK